MIDFNNPIQLLCVLLYVFITRTELHFVRCIKPNGRQQASNFDQSLIYHQLRCCGILEVARIAQAGYPTRYAHIDFADRYRLLLPGMPQGPLPTGVSPLDVCTRLLSHLGIDPSQYQIGRTKLFFRAGVLGRLEDRVIRINRAVLAIQSTWRMALQRRKFLEVKAAATAIEAAWRGCLGRRKAAERRSQRNAAVLIQTVWRGHTTRQQYRVTRTAVLCIQQGWRRLQARRQLHARMIVRHEEERKAAEQAAIRLSEQESYEALKKEFGVDGAYVREVLTVWKEHGERFQEYLDSVKSTTQDAAQGAAQGAEGTEQPLQLNESLKLYVLQLEEELEELRQQLLEQEQARAQEQLDDGNDDDEEDEDEEGEGEEEQDGRMETDRSHHSDTSVSIMSYSNDESFSPFQMKMLKGQPTNAINISATATAAQEIGPRPTIPVARFGRAGPEGAVAALQAEMAKKSALFDDDACFIREVHEGVSLAPSMDPYKEIDRLMNRYKAWQRDFKTRLKSTQEALRCSQRVLQENSSHNPQVVRLAKVHSSLPESKVSSKSRDGSLTARLMTFARGSRTKKNQSSQ